MTSNRGRRDVGRENRDSYGDQHFPGTGTAKRGGNHNAAVESGGGGGNGYFYDWVETWPSSSGYNGPRIVLAPVISGTAFEGDTLTLAVEPLWDGNQTTSSWVWLKNNVAVPGSLNQPTLTVTGVTPGDIWHVAATASNEEGGRTVTSNGILTLLEAPDITIPEQVFSAGQSLPHQLNFNDLNVGGAASAVAVNYGSVVGATVTFPDTPISRFVDWSATNTTGVDTGTFQLTINTPVVSVVSPIPDQSFLLGDAAVTFDLRTVFTNADEYSVVGPNSSILGDGYTLQVTASNLWTNAPVTVTGANAYNSLNDVFNLTVAAVAITAVQTPATSVLVVGQSLDDTTNWAAFLDTANYSSNAGTIVSAVPDFTGASVADATSAFADLDTNRFAVVVTDIAGNTRTFDTSSRTVVYALAVNTVAPVASGSTSLGDVLSVSNGTWTGAAGGAYSYQWQRDGVDISGATSSSYMIMEADDATDLRCVVTYTNSGGAVSANSNAITVDDFSIPVITGVPTITGTEAVSEVLTATAASTAGVPTPTRTWQWYNSVSGAIGGATSATYTLQASDEGDQVYVVQTETNGLGVDTAQSANTGVIAAITTISVEDSLDPAVTVPSGSTDPYVHTIDGVDYSVRKPDDTLLTVAMIEAASTYITEPVITGTPEDGATMTLTPAVALFAGDDPGDATFQVYLDDVLQSGETDVTYVIQAADENAVLKWVQTYDGVTIDSNEVTLTFIAVPDAFVGANWAVATGSGESELDITIASLPADNGATITDIEYDVGASDTWISLATATTGTVTVTMAAPSTSYAIRLRAVNSVGNGADGNSESATSGAGVATFDPADLFTSADGIWIEPDTSAMWTTTGRTENVTTDGASIGAIDDLSGNGYEFNAAGTAPIYRNTGGKQYITNVDFSGFSGAVALTTPQTYSLFVGMKTSSANGSLMGSGGNQYIGRYSDGSGSTTVTTVGSGLAFFADSGAAISPVTRDTLHTNFSTGSGVVAICEGLDMGAFPPAPLYYNGTLALDGDVYCIIMVETAVADANRADIISYIQGKF